MIGYKSLEEFTLEDCHNFVSQRESDAYYGEVNDQYEALLDRTTRQEEADYMSCKTINDYDRFMVKYRSMSSYYQSKRLEDAARAKRHLVAEAQQREDELRRRERQQEEEKEQRRKRVLVIALSSLVLAAVVVFFIGYKPVKALSVEDVSFGKEGGTKSLRIETNVGYGAINVETPKVNWIEVNLDGRMLNLTARPNPDPERSCTIEVKAYSTFFGEYIGTPKKREVVIRQSSGYATNLDVSTKSISVGKYGETNQINVKTDGVKLEISANDWINVTPKSQNHDGQYYHDDNYEIKIGSNPTGNRAGRILVETGGLQQEVSVFQSSGLASYFSLSRTSIGIVDKSGSEEGKCFRVNVTTDGTTWTASTNNGWLDLSQYGNTLDIKVRENSGDVRTGYVYVYSNNDHSETITIDQDGNPSSFYANSSSLTFDTGKDYEYVSFSNNSLQSVYSSGNKSWLSTSISGNSVKISCESNSGSPRDGIVTLTCGNKETEIAVHQKGWTTCYNCNNGTVSCDNYNAIWTYDNWGNWGHGYVTIDGWGNRYVSVCGVCGGTGRKTCPKCGGKGKIKSN